MKTQYIVSINRDTDSENPRHTFDNFGTLYTWHPRYSFGCAGDISNGKPHKFADFLAFDVLHVDLNLSEDEAKAIIKENICMVPIYIYDHSGISIQTTPFSCPWDSGQVGWIYATKENCKEEGIAFEDAGEVLKSEIEELNQFLTGDVWGYTIYSQDVEDDCDDFVFIEGVSDYLIPIESCWGYYGYEYCKNEALRLVNGFIKNKQEIANAIA